MCERYCIRLYNNTFERWDIYMYTHLRDTTYIIQQDMKTRRISVLYTNWRDEPYIYTTRPVKDTYLCPLYRSSLWKLTMCVHSWKETMDIYSWKKKEFDIHDSRLCTNYVQRDHDVYSWQQTMDIYSWKTVCIKHVNRGQGHTSMERDLYLQRNSVSFAHFFSYIGLFLGGTACKTVLANSKRDTYPWKDTCTHEIALRRCLALRCRSFSAKEPLIIGLFWHLYTRNSPAVFTCFSSCKSLRTKNFLE